MRIIGRAVLAAFGLLALVVTANAQTESVATNASASATYPTTTQTAGPFPWNDLGITASASVSPGSLSASVGGATSFTLNSTVTGNEIFTPGITALNVGYTPNWNGSINSSSSGNFKSDFVYHLGPFNGSQNILNVPLSNSVVGDLGPSLQAGIPFPLTASNTANGPGIGLGFGLKAQACFIGCVTVASVSLNFNIGTQLQQTVVASPTPTYGDLVWYSKTQTFSASAAFVTGSLGNVQNKFSPPLPGSLGLVSGDTLYFNFLPAVLLHMPIGNSAEVDVPASISANWNILGITGSTSASGNLYALPTGSESFNFDASWYGSNFYSVPLQYTLTCTFPGVPCTTSYDTPNSVGSPVLFAGVGVPSDIPPSNFTGGPWPGGPDTGYGSVNLGPLFPAGVGDGVGTAACNITGGVDSVSCISQVTSTPTPTPEPGSLLLLVTGLLGLAVLRRRKLCW